MPLRSDQNAFAEALHDPEAGVPQDLLGRDGMRSEKRFSVYRNNVTVSLVEALLILPAHLSSGANWNRFPLVRLTNRINQATHKALTSFVQGPFARFVAKAVKWRYVTLATGVAIFLVTIGFIAGGYIKFVFFGTVEADNMIATLKMPLGTPVEQTGKITDRIEKAALQALEEFDSKRPGKPPLMKHMSVTVGAHPMAARGGPVRRIHPGGRQLHGDG